MSPQVLGPVRPIALLGIFLVSTAGAGLTTQAAHATECLTAPKAHTPKGGHWYYRTDRVHHRKCWYLRVGDQTVQPSAAATRPDAAPATDVAPAAATSAPAKKDADSVWSAPPASPQTAVIGGATDEAQPSDPNATAAPQAEASPEATPNAPAGPTSASPQQSDQTADTTPAADTVLRDQPARAETTAAPVQPQATVGTKDTAAAGTAAARAANTDPANTDNPASKAFASATTPLGLLLIVALALALTGILYRVLLKVLAMRGPRVIIDRSADDWREERYEEAPTVPRQQATEKLAPSLAPPIAEMKFRYPRVTGDARLREPPGSRIVPAKPNGKHDERLTALMRDLDQLLLQTRNGK
ncbi:MAG: hypothetical protein P8Z80_11655 [Pseudolabrys sp.]